MRKRIGEFLVEKGVLTPGQVNQILKYGQDNGLRFGEAGQELGILTREQLISVFGPSFAIDFFHLDSKYYPEVTRDLFAPEMLVRLGMLPLGFKTEKKLFRTQKVLNLGLLDPSRRDAVDEAMRAAVTKLGDGQVQGVKVFLVLADQFLSVLSRVYGMDDAELRGRDASQVDGTLAMFLESGR
jgi:hypothetical protein